MVRELGPVLTALMVTGRVGSGMAAELGSMVVTPSSSLAASTEGLNYTSARSFSPVPEPGNVALLLAGLGVEGMTLLRRASSKR